MPESAGEPDPALQTPSASEGGPADDLISSLLKTSAATPSGDDEAASKVTVDAVAKNIVETQLSLERERLQREALERELELRSITEKSLSSTLEEERRYRSSLESEIRERSAQADEQRLLAKKTAEDLAAARARTSELVRDLEQKKETESRLKEALEHEKGESASSRKAISLYEKKIEDMRASAAASENLLSDALQKQETLEQENRKMASETSKIEMMLSSSENRARRAAEETLRLESELADATGTIRKIEAMLSEAHEKNARQAEQMRLMEERCERALSEQKTTEEKARSEREASRQALEKMESEARETISSLQKALAEQEAALKEGADSGPADDLKDLAAQTKESLEGYQEFLSKILFQATLANESTESLARTKDELAEKIEELKRSISEAGERMGHPVYGPAVQTPYGAVVVRHVHDYPAAPPLTPAQKASLVVSRVWDAAKQAVFWAALAVLLSIAATMVANGGDLPSASSLLYESTIGKFL